MKKGFIFFALILITLTSCRRQFTCECDFVQRTLIINDLGNEEEVRTDEKYSSNISYTSKKLATEECDERGRSIGLDTMRVDAACKVIKKK